MARKTLAEKISDLETKLTSLETLKDSQKNLDTVEGTGNQGAVAKFGKRDTLTKEIQDIENKLANLYRQQESC